MDHRMTAESLWRYYREAAGNEGLCMQQTEDGGVRYYQSSASVWWFFAAVEQMGLDRLNPLTRAFLSSQIHRKALLGETEAAVMEESFLGQAPNSRQREAILRALGEPISLIQGPPGTGKTETIVNLLYQIYRQGRTAAVVSSNKEALRTIREKLADTELASVVAELGNRVVREPALRPFRPNGAEGTEAICYVADSWNGPVRCMAGKAGQAYWEEASASRPPETPREEYPLRELIRREKEVTAGQFLETHPIFTSTIHSLPNCFRDGLLYQYDYVIVDEASQLDTYHGLIAMSHARHLVVVGDEEQLPPVLTDDLIAAMEQRFAACTGVDDGLLEEPPEDSLWPLLTGELPDVDPAQEEPEVWAAVKQMAQAYRLRKDRSFLDACMAAFLDPRAADRGVGLHGRVIKTFLKDHYRCHPGIIRFCNEEVYGGRLEVHTRWGQTFVPVKFLWFDGDYCERCYAETEDAGKEGKVPRRTKRNCKQLEIFLREEWPELSRRLRADETLRVGILVPFNMQKTLLEEELWRREETYLEEHPNARRLLPPRGQKGQRSGMEADQKDQEPSCQVLTIHKAQGKGYDVVYLLGVEDGYWNWPWSQQKRMVNVVVSRAKKELRVISSAQYMSPEVRRALGLKVYQENRAGDENLFLQKLADYTLGALRELEASGKAGQYPDQAQFGFHRARLVSIFDDKPWYQFRARQLAEALKSTCTSFAPEQCVWTALRQVLNGLPPELQVRLRRRVPVRTVLEPLGGEVPLELEAYYQQDNTHFDLVLLGENGRLLLAVEVDGADHRSAWAATDGRDPETAYRKWQDRLQLYQNKDEIVRAFGGDVYYGNQRDGSGGQWAAEEGRFALLRLPDDGTTFLETDALRGDCADETIRGSVLTLEDFIRRYTPLSMTRTVQLWTREGPETVTDLLRTLEQTEGKRRVVPWIQERLAELGFLKREAKHWAPTEMGQGAGIRLQTLENGNAYPVYPGRARDLMARALTMEATV